VGVLLDAFDRVVGKTFDGALPGRNVRGRCVSVAGRLRTFYGDRLCGGLVVVFVMV
jgi:hypothetical protein